MHGSTERKHKIELERSGGDGRERSVGDERDSYQRSRCRRSRPRSRCRRTQRRQLRCKYPLPLPPPRISTNPKRNFAKPFFYKSRLHEHGRRQAWRPQCVEGQQPKHIYSPPWICAKRAGQRRIKGQGHLLRLTWACAGRRVASSRWTE